MAFLENEMGRISLSHHWTCSVSAWVLPTSMPCCLSLAPTTIEAGLWTQKTKSPWLVTSSAAGPEACIQLGPGFVSFFLVCFARGDFCLMTKTVPFRASLWLRILSFPGV